ncbi:cytochrome P450 85A-like [Apium graveolens]|uniref:cytochrome P450 85A-like n=1 Tax=Apium graveolens TaxID=4045 RepID=UPI003D7BD2B9
MDPEVNKYILLNEAKGLVPGYPKAMNNILGKNNIGAVHASPHKILRGSLLSLIAPTLIKDSLLPKIDKTIRYVVNGLDGKTIDIQEKSEEMAYLVSFSQIFSNIEPSSSLYNVLKSEFDKLTLGTLSLPIHFPGTNYYKGLKSSKNILRIVSKIIEERRVASAPPLKDQLNELLGIIDSKYELSDEDVINQIITLLYSGYETVSTTTMMVLKYLHDHPKALQELRDEHFRIREGKKPDEPIKWDEYKSMTFTRAVIFEATRLITVVNGVLRRTIEDVELSGFVIPKGWKIYVYTREINYDPFLYPEPFTFNPWRWMKDKSLESHKYNLLFGGGTRLCPGKELAIVKISLFLHYFVTSYRWEEVGEQKILRFPRVQAPDGLKIRVSGY